jgi:hypothetical protein
MYGLDGTAFSLFVYRDDWQDNMGGVGGAVVDGVVGALLSAL